MREKNMRVDYKTAADFLCKNDDYIILTHQNPDGDTIGAGFALCYALRSLGKKANVLCSDEFPEKYAFLTENCQPMKFKHDNIIAVDIADEKLLGSKLVHYGEYVKLCIDHHKSNTGYAEMTLLNKDAAATCEVMFELLLEMNVNVNSAIAQCLYTGIATDTGCFKFSCTTKRTHNIVAEILDCGVPFDRINREIFDIKTKERIELERHILSNIEYLLDDKCSIAVLTNDVIKNLNVKDGDFEGISALTLQLRGILVGIVMKEREDGKFKVSVRSTSDEVDVSEICSKLGGGGHSRAAGCLLEGDIETLKRQLLATIAPYLNIDLWVIEN